jgi:hypothetical protein
VHRSESCFCILTYVLGELCNTTCLPRDIHSVTNFYSGKAEIPPRVLHCMNGSAALSKETSRLQPLFLVNGATMSPD